MTDSARQYPRKWRRGALSILVSALGAAVFSCPLIYAYSVDADYIALEDESLAYRYGHAHRIAAGDTSMVWLPQGYTLGIIQRGIYGVLSDPSSITAFRDALNQFGFLTGLTFCSLVLMLLLVVNLDPRLSVHQKLWPYFSILAAEYGLGSAGLFYALGPDYYFLNVIFVGASVYLFLRGWSRFDDPVSVGAVLALGAFVGCVGANKISMLPVASLAAAPVVLRSAGSWRRLLGVVLCLGGAALSSFVAVHLIYFGFEIGRLMAVFPRWMAFVIAPGAEADFWSKTLGRQLIARNYLWVGLFFLAALGLSMAGAVAASSKGSWRVGMRHHAPGSGASRFSDEATTLLACLWLLVVGLVAVWAVGRRPADTTLFESASIVLGVASAFLGIYVARGWGLAKQVGWVLAAAWVSLALATMDREGFGEKLRQSRQRADASWSLHRYLESFEKPVVVVIEDDRFGSKSVEKLLLKAFADFPSWSVTGGKRQLALLGSLSFRSLQSHDQPDQAYPSGVVLAQFERPDLDPPRGSYAALEGAQKRSGADCVRWSLDDASSAFVCDLP